MNSLLINLGHDVSRIPTLIKEIKECQTAIELPNNSWLVLSDNDMKWWNNYLYEQVKAAHPNVDKVGSIKRAYFIVEVNEKLVCGLLDKSVTAKLRELKGPSKPAKTLKPIQNLLDRMDIEEDK